MAVDDGSTGTTLALDIYDLHSRHHIGKGATDSYVEAALVCLDRHHVAAEMTWSVQKDGEPPAQYVVERRPPTAAHYRSGRNRDEATELGACAMVLAASDRHLGLVALSRAEGLTGSDFYLIPASANVAPDPDLDLFRDDRIRLEVSGISDDDARGLEARVRQKVLQARAGHSPLPAIAGVVGFRTARIVFRTAKD
jgi:hypothetical protein